MSTVEKQLMDFEESLAEDGHQLKEGEREALKTIATIAFNTTKEQYAKALALASRMAQALLSELVPGEPPILHETINPKDEEWLDLVELSGMSPEEAGLERPTTPQKTIIYQAFLNGKFELAAFTLGVAIGQRLELKKKKARGSVPKASSLPPASTSL